jgi:hypothetical protein
MRLFIYVINLSQNKDHATKTQEKNYIPNGGFLIGVFLSLNF